MIDSNITTTTTIQPAAHPNPTLSNTTSSATTPQSPDFPLLVEGMSLEKIPFYSSKGVVEYLSPEEFQIKFGCQYSESFFVTHRNLLAQFPGELNQTPTDHDTLARERLHTPCTSVAISDTGNDDLRCGCKAIKDIRKGTCVMLYPGVLSLYEDSDKSSSYSFCLINGMWLDAKKVGGLARFINHMPSNIEWHRSQYAEMDNNYLSALKDPKLRAELSKILNDPIYFEQAQTWHNASFIADLASSVEQGSRSELATANLAQTEVNIDGITMIAFFALCDIKEGADLGYDYGLRYWDSEPITPTYSKTNGDVIASGCTSHSNSVPTVQNKTVPEIKEEGKAQYASGQAAFKLGKYHEVFQHILKAINTFSHKKNENIRELVTCYSALATLFKKFKMERAFFVYCDIAIKLAYDINHPMENPLIEPVLKKYNDYMSDKSSDSTDKATRRLVLQESAKELLTQRQHHLSLYAFLQLIDEIEKDNGSVPPLLHVHLGHALGWVGDKGRMVLMLEEALTHTRKEHGVNSKQEREIKLKIAEFTDFTLP